MIYKSLGPPIQISVNCPKFSCFFCRGGAFLKEPLFFNNSQMIRAYSFFSDDALTYHSCPYTQEQQSSVRQLGRGKLFERDPAWWSSYPHNHHANDDDYYLLMIVMTLTITLMTLVRSVMRTCGGTWCCTQGRGRRALPSEGRMSEVLPVFDDISQLGCGNVVMACRHRSLLAVFSASKAWIVTYSVLHEAQLE